MKAKKIIAIVLIAAMTSGMSTSVFAYDDYSDYPQFDNWGDQFEPYDNAFHAKGQGWLEGEGANESAVNVIVPTRPNIALEYGDPDIFDFGIDPQRLVDRTEAKKYEGKNYFTDTARIKGVYFMIGTTEESGNKNAFNNESVKYEATNIGTEDLELTVTATLKGAENFAYLEEAPVYTATEALRDLYAKVADAKVAENKSWESIHNVEEHNIYHFARETWVYRPQWNVQEFFGEKLFQFVYAFECMLFVKEGEEVQDPNNIYNGRQIVDNCIDEDNPKHVQNLNEFIAEMDSWIPVKYDENEREYKPANPDEVGMFLGLNVATGKEGEPYGDPTETPLRKDPSNPNNAKAEFTQELQGNPNNYKWDWVPGAKAYRYVINPERSQPFETAAFWFRGVSTKNSLVPDDVKIPQLDFTWKFSTTIKHSL